MMHLMPFEREDFSRIATVVANDDEGCHRMAYYADAVLWAAGSAACGRRALRVHDDEGVLVGFVDFEAMRDEPAASFAYYVLPQQRGKRLANQLLRALTAWTRDNTGINRLTAYVEIDNVASNRALNGANFAHDGEVDGMRVYRLNIWR